MLCVIDVPGPFLQQVLGKLSSNFEDGQWYVSTFSGQHTLVLVKTDALSLWLTLATAARGCRVGDWMCLNISRRRDFHALWLKLQNYWLLGIPIIIYFFKKSKLSRVRMAVRFFGREGKQEVSVATMKLSAFPWNNTHSSCSDLVVILMWLLFSLTVMSSI